MTAFHTPRLVVLVSGKGSNFEAVVQATRSGQIPAQVVALISNRPQAGALERATRLGIPAKVINHQTYPDRTAFDQALMTTIDAYEPDLVILAGFMRILTPGFVEHYLGRLINIHPSLLPQYPGLHTHARALADQVRQHGASVHFVTQDLDGGPVVLQAAVPIQEGDTAERLAERVHAIEHRLYPLAITWFVMGRLRLEHNRATLDGSPLEGPLRLESMTAEASRR